MILEDATIDSLLQVVSYLKTLIVWHGLSIWDIMLAWFLVSAVTSIIFRAKNRYSEKGDSENVE